MIIIFIFYLFLLFFIGKKIINRFLRIWIFIIFYFGCCCPSSLNGCSRGWRARYVYLQSTCSCVFTDIPIEKERSWFFCLFLFCSFRDIERKKNLVMTEVHFFLLLLILQIHLLEGTEHGQNKQFFKGPRLRLFNSSKFF